MHDRKRGISIAVASAVVFGFWPTAVRGIYADGGNVVFALLITTWARALSMAVFSVLKRRRLFQTKADIREALIGGGMQAISGAALLFALVYLPGPVVIIILFSHTLILLFFMAWRREIKLDRFTVATTVIALVGLSIVLDLWHKQPPGSWMGAALAFTGALATVCRLYAYGKQTKDRHPIVVGAENFLVAALFLTLLMFYKLPVMPVSLSGWSYAVTGALAMTLGTFGMFYGISLLGSFQWSLFLKLEPVFTALFSALFLNEILKTGQYVGIAVVITSLVTYQLIDYRRKKTIIAVDTGLTE